MKSPDAPNPNKVAAAQSAADVNTAIAQQGINMVNQVTPYGNLTYNPSGNMSWTDPNTGKTIQVPRFTATQTFSPAQQALFEQEQQFDKMYNDIALAQTGKVGAHLSEPFDYNAGEYEGWAGNLYDTLNAESNQRTTDMWDQKLKNQGLSPGSAAYDDAMKNVITSQNRDRTAFMLDAYGTGLNTALTMRNQPLNETIALATGAQVQQPQFTNTPSVSMQSPDLAGMIQSNYQNQLASRNAMIGGLSGLGGAALGGWASGGFG